jgi:uncharacterized membrane protein
VTDASAPPLRPLGVGDIVDRTITLYRASPWLFITLAAIPYLVFAVLSLVLGGVLFVGATRLPTIDPNADPAALLNMFSALIPAAIVYGIVILVVFSAQAASLIDAMSKRHLGVPTTVRDSLLNGLRASLRLILAAICAFVVFVGVIIAAFIAVAILNTLLTSALVGVGGVIAICVLMFYAIASLMVVPAAVTIEHVGPIRALRRSAALAKGARWRILGLLLLMFVLLFVLELLLAVVLLTVVGASTGVQLVAQQVVGVIVNVLWSPIQWGVFTVLYYDLRVRKEAFDLQLAAEAMPRAT